jgi:hypothetical protein
MYLSEKECDIVIRALTKVLETEPPYARADEYKKLLDRLKREHSKFGDENVLDVDRYDYDDS